MKEFRRQKNKKRTSEDFIKARKRHVLIQNNRDQLKLLNDGKIETATLIILKKYSYGLTHSRLVEVTVKKIDRTDSWWLDRLQGSDVVYYSHGNGHRARLGIGYYADKYGAVIDPYLDGHVNTNDIIAEVIDTKILKEYKSKRPMV